MKIYQLVSHPQKKDAIGRMALNLNHLYKQNGHEGLIFTEKKESFHIGKYYFGCLRKGLLQSTPWGGFEAPDIAMYQHSSGSIVADRFIDWPAQKKILIYQNITPIELLSSEQSKKHAAWGLEQLPKLIQAATVCVGTSRFNCEELKKYGAKEVIQIPYLLEKPKTFFQRKPNNLVLMVSRIEPYKGILEGVEAFALIKKENPTYKMVIIGNTRANPDYVNKISKRIEELHLTKDIKIVGRISDFWLDYYYSRANLLLILSLHEGFCVPIIEAIQREVPVIAYDAGAVAETLGIGGKLVNSRKSEDILGAFSTIKNQNWLAAQKQRMLDMYQNLEGFLKIIY
jgi:glycosyltransferase involved in cell wall biosynthesis